VPRYATTGIPAQLASGEALGLSAFMPHYNRLAASGAQSYKGGVTGRPGTAAIKMNPAKSGIPPSPDPGDMAQMGTSRTSDAPDAIWPNQYYDNPAIVGTRDGNNRYYPGAGMPVQIYDPTRPQDTTMIPVPATDYRAAYQARAASLAGGVAPVQGGGPASRAKALKQATQFLRWPQRGVGNGSNQ
jgi:hypothetical protein